jgi:hypothetical protein
MSDRVSSEELSLAELEARVHRDDRESREALLTIVRTLLYVEAGLTFIAYATDRFGYSNQHTYRLLRVAALEDALAEHESSPIGDA